MKSRKAYAILLAGAFLWCVALVVPSLVGVIDAHDSPLVKQCYAAFSSICHQRDSHSLTLFGAKTAVCSRCLAIYTGFALAVLIVPAVGMKQRSSRWLFVAAVPMIVDVGLAFLGIREPNTITRLITGGFFGIVSGLALTPLIIEGLSEFLTRFKQPQGARYEPKT